MSAKKFILHADDQTWETNYNGLVDFVVKRARNFCDLYGPSSYRPDLQEDWLSNRTGHDNKLLGKRISKAVLSEEDVRLTPLQVISLDESMGPDHVLTLNNIIALYRMQRT